MKAPNARPGMTLMEIMMSVMILGLGLLGILSVIPFIEFHSARVVESDFTAAAGTNAFAVIQSNQWENPANWVYPNAVEGKPETGNPEDYRLPRLFDIFGEGNIGLDTGIIQRVYPVGDYGSGARAQDICRGRDDLVVERDENSPARPQLLFDESGDTDSPEFTGAYSWAALMSPIASDPAQSYLAFTFPGHSRVIDDNRPRAEVAMKVDVLVFRGRDALDDNDWITAPVTAVN